jgi:hypothetical protein
MGQQRTDRYVRFANHPLVSGQTEIHSFQSHG